MTNKKDKQKGQTIRANKTADPCGMTNKKDKQKGQTIRANK
jgi:hypothetical protein